MDCYHGRNNKASLVGNALAMPHNPISVLQYHSSFIFHYLRLRVPTPICTLSYNYGVFGWEIFSGNVLSESPTVDNFFTTFSLLITLYSYSFFFFLFSLLFVQLIASMMFSTILSPFPLYSFSF